MPTFPNHLDVTTLDGNNGYVLVGDVVPDAFDDNGATLAGVGDMNGDGLADILVGAPHLDDQYNGRVYMVQGTDAPHAAVEGLGGWGTFAGQASEYEYFGSGLGALGDINGDGFADAIIYGTGGGFSDAPGAYVVFGAAGLGGGGLAGLDGTNGFKIAEGGIGGIGDINGDGCDDFASGRTIIFGKTSDFSEYFTTPVVDGGNGFTLSGTFGGFTSAGDVNGDGFDDLIVGNASGDSAGTDAGEAYILFGKAGGFSATIDPATVDGTTGFKITGAAAGNNAGITVNGIGDVNGDGYDDVAVGATGGGGVSYVVFGKASGFEGGIDLGALDSTSGYKVSGIAYLGRAGDINGDTLDDLGIGINGVLFGRAGVSVRDLTMADLDGTNGFVATGPGLSAGAWAGDVNGDGFDDFVLSNPLATTQYYDQTYTVGEIYVILGHADGPRSWTGTSADELYVGSASRDVLKGAGGKDHLKGVGGDDVLVGGSGSDLLDGGDGSDTVSFAGSSAGVVVDLAAGTSTGTGQGNDTLIGIENVNGSNGNDDIGGDAGANRLDGGLGDDRMAGRGGDDTYVVDQAGDTVVELAGDGTDTIVTSLDVFRLPAGVENLVYVGGGDFTGTGNGLDNIITGGGGDDVLNGGGGADRLEGGEGGDRYIVDDAGDVVVDSGATGTDRVESTITYGLGGDIENLLLRGTGRINGTGNALDNAMTGNTAANTLDGGDGDDRLSGLGGNDKLIGGAGADRLDGGTGDDRMYGGLGDDIYVVDSVGDTVSEAGGGGYDLVRAAVSFTLNSGLDDLILNTDTATDGTGNTLANTITGGAGDNILSGLGGNDVLSGGLGNDRLDGGSGDDILRGGAGDDTYVVDSYNDLVIESTGGGIDTVVYGGSGNHYTMAAHIENAVLADSTAGHVRGNTLDNAIIGSIAPDTIEGGAGDDILTGGGANGGSSDSFVYRLGFGHDRITDFQSGDHGARDDLIFDDDLFADFADIMAHAAQVGGNVVITHDADNSITLEGVVLSELTEGNFYIFSLV